MAPKYGEPPNYFSKPIDEDLENDEHIDMMSEEDEVVPNEETIPHMNETNHENATDGGQAENLDEESRSINIDDPSNWNNIDQKLREFLVERGPVRRDVCDDDFPKDNTGRHFSSSYYIRHLSNGEKHDRKWLVYSDIVDRVYCFCCKLFKDQENMTQLANDGHKDWRHMSECLRCHEKSNEHITCMSNWIELELRLRKNETLDKSLQEQINKDREHYEKTFGFLFDLKKFSHANEDCLKSYCVNLENVLKHDGISDIDGAELHLELKVLKNMLPEGSEKPIEVLNCLKNMNSCFPNAWIAYRILLTIPVTVASGERSFSKLKLIKTYLRSTMSQERLNGLAMLSIEKEMAAELDYTNLITTFASKNARRAKFM